MFQFARSVASCVKQMCGSGGRRNGERERQRERQRKRQRRQMRHQTSWECRTPFL